MMPEGYDTRPLSASDAAGLAAAYDRNREHLAPWEPVRRPSFYTVQGHTAVIESRLDSIAAGLGMSWTIRQRDEIVGMISLNNLVRGTLQSVSVGYWLDAGHQGRGVMTEAVEFACDQARGVGLHRVEACTLVHNERSMRVLTRCGFEEYGLARDFLFIAGRWQDHRLFQRILHDRPLVQPTHPLRRPSAG